MKQAVASLSALETCEFRCRSAAGDFLCHCAQVTELEVRTAVEVEGAASVGEVSAATGAGSGCRACRCRIQRVLEGLPAVCGGRFDLCRACGCFGAVCRCAGVSADARAAG